MNIIDLLFRNEKQKTYAEYMFAEFYSELPNPLEKLYVSLHFDKPILYQSSNEVSYNEYKRVAICKKDWNIYRKIINYEQKTKEVIFDTMCEKNKPIIFPNCCENVKINHIGIGAKPFGNTQLLWRQPLIEPIETNTLCNVIINFILGMDSYLCSYTC